MLMNSTITAPITLSDKAIEDVEHIAYLGSVADTQGVTEADVKTRLGKAMVPFLQLKNIWKSKVLFLKIRIFITSVKAVLLCRAET